MDTDRITETHYCYGNGNSLETALLANGGFGGGWNNPWVLLLVLMMRNGFGYGHDGDNYNSRAIAQLQSTVDNNHNNQAVLDALSNNQAAIRELAQTFNTNTSTIQQAICGIRASVESISGQIGFSAERVINAVNLGNQGILSKICECCCQTQQNLLKMGYESQLATERQTNILGSKMDTNHAAEQLQLCQYHGGIMGRIEQLANGVTQGFSAIGYQAAADKNEIIQAGNVNTQRIIDTLNSHWQSDLQQRYADARLELSQLRQNATLIAALTPTPTT